MMSGEGETRVAGGFPRQGAAQRIEIARIDPAVVVEVLGIAVAVEVDARHAHAQRVADRQVDHPLDLLRIVIAVLEFAGGVETREIGLGGAEVDDARGTIGMESCRARVCQYVSTSVVALAYKK